MGIALGVLLGLSAGCGRSTSERLERAVNDLRGGRTASAARQLERIVARAPNQADAWANLGIARLDLGRTNEALTAFAQAAKLAPNDPRPLEFIADLHARRGRWGEARAVLTAADRRDPRSPRLLTALALAEWHAGAPAASLNHLERAVSLAPHYGPALFTMAILQRDAFHNESAARLWFERFLNDAPGDPHAVEARRWLFATPGRLHPLADKDEHNLSANSAATLWQAALAAEKKDPDSDEAALAWRVFLTRCPNDRRAAEARAKLVRIANTVYNFGIRAQQAGRPADAIPFYLRSVQCRPEMATAHYNLGLAYRETGDNAHAQEAFAAAVTAKPDLAAAHYMLALSLRDLGQTNAMLQAFNETLRTDPNYADAHFALALCYAPRPPDRQLARRHFLRYLELSPESPSAGEIHRWLTEHQ